MDFRIHSMTCQEAGQLEQRIGQYGGAGRCTGLYMWRARLRPRWLWEQEEVDETGDHVVSWLQGTGADGKSQVAVAIAVAVAVAVRQTETSCC